MNKQIDYGIKRYSKYCDIPEKNLYRIIRVDRESTLLVNQSGNFFTGYPTSNIVNNYYVGDYVRLVDFDNKKFIKSVEPRINIVSKASNKTAKNYNYSYDEQILATNVDQIFILIASNQRFTISKLERYLLTFSRDNIKVSIIITKSDFKKPTQVIREMIHNYYPNLSIYYTSNYDSASIFQLKNLIQPQETVILLGSSGVGKSTLINTLQGVDTERTSTTRSGDSKGKHTTTYTKLIYIDILDCYLIDTPGFKGIDTTNEVNMNILFERITILSQSCKFRDCQHISEPQCAVKTAVENGEITQEYYERYIINQQKQKGYEAYIKQKAQKKRTKKSQRSSSN